MKHLLFRAEEMTFLVLSDVHGAPVPHLPLLTLSAQSPMDGEGGICVEKWGITAAREDTSQEKEKEKENENEKVREFRQQFCSS